MAFSRLVTVSLCSSLALALAGCGDPQGASDSGSDGESSDSGETADETDGASSNSTDGSSATDPGGSESDSGVETTGSPVVMAPAKGISITHVEANQGTRVDIGQGADWVDGAGRDGFLVRDRDMMLRVHYTVDPNWVAHDVEARLLLKYPDGTEETKTQTVEVTGDSFEGELKRTFYFGLVAEEGQVQPGTKFQVELWEDEAMAVGDEGVWATPASGPNFIGLEADPMELKIVLVPIHYQADGKDIIATVTDSDLQAIENYFHEANPVQRVLLEVHDPLPYTQSVNGLSPILNATAQLRQQENPAPNVYYHALLDQGCQFTGCTNGRLLGQAIDIPGPGQGQGYLRVASSMYHTPDDKVTEMSLETIVHEHGHSQGQYHIFCPGGGAAGTDNTYPDPDGKIQAWGFGIRYFTLHNPNVEVDYMSYCRPQWFGPWTWNKAYERIRALTSWDQGDVPQPPTYPILIGAHNSDGSTEWWTADGVIPPERLSATETIQFTIGGETTAQPAAIHEMVESDEYWVVTPLPASLDSIKGITHVSGEQSTPINPASVRALHHTADFVSP